MPASPPVEASSFTATQSGPAFAVGQTPVADLAAIIAATDRLAQLEDGDRLTREAVEFARDMLGMERISIFLVQATETQVVMRGTWGTNDRGRTTDERGLAHCCAREDFESLRTLHQHGALWQYRALEAHDTDRRRLPWTREDRAWLAITPLVAAREVVGVMYNDTAISKAPLDRTKQTNLAVFGSLLAGLAHDRLARQSKDPFCHAVVKTSRFILKVLSDLEREPQLSGELLAQRFRVSPGHLARTFKTEVGTSLVEYRNRLRLERFFAIMQAGQRNLLEAALEAGFGSYAQFHRVHRRVTGSAPRKYFSNGSQTES